MEIAYDLRVIYARKHGLIASDPVMAARRPLELVAETPRDGNRRMYMRYKRYHEYRIYNVWDNYHLTLMEFINLPTADIEWMLQDIAAENEIKKNAQARAESDTP